MIRIHVARDIAQQKILGTGDFYRLRGCYITVADNSSVLCNAFIVATISIKDGINDTLSRDLIIGQPGLYQLYDHRGCLTRVCPTEHKVLVAISSTRGEANPPRSDRLWRVCREFDGHIADTRRTGAKDFHVLHWQKEGTHGQSPPDAKSNRRAAG